MKILFDYQAFYNQKIGGVSRSKFYLISSLKRNTQCEVSLIAPFSSNEYLCSKNRYIVNLVFLLSPQIYDLFLSLRRIVVRKFINFKLKYFPPDIFIPTYYDSYFLKSLGRTPFVLTIHDMIHEIYFNDSDLYKKVINQKKDLIFKSSAIIAVSENTKLDIIKIYPNINVKKIHVVYWGNSFANLSILHNRPSKKRTLLYVGKRQDYKNFSWFIDIISDWLNFNDFQLLCIGGDSFSDKENQKFNISLISHRVSHLILDDASMANQYLESFAIIIPSLYEGFGFPMIEAMSLNCPVLFNDQSSLPEIASYAGMKFSVNNPNTLIDNLNQLLNDSKIYDEQICLGRKRSYDFNWNLCANMTLDVYKSV